MKTALERRRPNGALDYVSLVLTTFGVGYLPLAPGTYGSAVGVAMYVAAGDAVSKIERMSSPKMQAVSDSSVQAAIGVLMLIFCLLGVWAAGRSIELLGNSDPPEAVVDEVIGQLITFLFVPFFISWPFIVAGFVLFRLFDIWKPYPIDSLQILPGGIGVCADDVVAGVYAGICLSVIYALSLSV